MRVSRMVVVALVLAVSAGVVAQKRSITEKDIFQFNWIGDPQISPDGSHVAFVKVTVNEKKDGYDTSIWSVSTRGDEAPRRITDGKHDASPRWSPDGRWLVFVRSPETPAGGAGGGGARQPTAATSAQLYMLPMSGGESWKFTDLPRGAGGPVWSPDGKTIAFISDTSPEDLAKAHKKGGRDRDGDGDKSAAKGDGDKSTNNNDKDDKGGKSGHGDSGDDEHESDVRVITRSVYRMNGGGYLDFKHPGHIWVVAAPQSSDDVVTPRQLTSGKYSEQGIMWSKDSQQIYYASDQVDDPSYELPHTDIWAVSAAGTEGSRPQKITTINMAIREASLSPDGRRLAFCASVNEPVLSYTEPDLWVMDLAANATPKNLTDSYDYDVCSGVGGDQGTPRAAGGNRVVWSGDGKSVIATTAREGKANLVAFDVATGQPKEITRGNHAVERYSALDDGSVFAAVISTPTSIGDLYLFYQPGHAKQLTHINDKLFSQLNLTEPEEIWYTSFDGKKIQAWVQKPPDFDASKKYPLILNIHGGPHAAYGFIFDHEIQWMAAKGYVVLYPNPRGSTSYGQQFGNIIQYHYPGDDFKDLMAGVDEVVKRGYIDPKKLGVTGGSGGGLLTNWVIGHTDRFAAAVAQRDIASWADWWYSADFTLFQASWFKAPPFDDPQDYVNRSPITYIKNVHTPLMLILGEADYRTPPGAGGEEMFRALKYLKRPVIMIRFPGESHELSRSGQPWHRVERLEHIVGWFDKYLQGMEKAEYNDVTPATPSAKTSE
jgi:dipeptidyl aminopeptidase/acylaminoacyl peptidase